MTLRAKCNHKEDLRLPASNHSRFSPHRMSTCKAGIPLHEGKNLTIGSKEIELERIISKESFLSGSCFGRSSVDSLSETVTRPKASKKFAPPSLLVATGTSSTRTMSLSQDPIPNKFHAHAEACKPDTTLCEVTNEPSHWVANWYIPNHFPCLRDMLISSQAKTSG